MQTKLNRRSFLTQSALASATLCAADRAVAALPPGSAPGADAPLVQLPCGTIGKVKISRVLLGGNLVSGYMHARDLKYVGPLFRAYVTEQKLMETFRLAEQCGINTVFETGGNFIKKYNTEYGGHMQFIPHIEIKPGQSDDEMKKHIAQQMATGAVALYVWGVAADKLVQLGDIKQLARGVELARTTGLPIGVGGHSLQVPMACEKYGVPCDFYVKTLHSDNYPSATPKPLRKDFMWQGGVDGFYDNMWCIDPEETIAFMKTVKKPWVAFKVLAAGAFYPRDGFPYAFKNGADFIAVGMFDFQIKANAELAAKTIRLTQQRERGWMA